jgi:hypothetical protein
MRGLISPGINASFFLAGEYSRLQETLRSSDYSILATRGIADPPATMPAAQIEAGQAVVLVSGSISATDAVQILRTRVLESREIRRSTGDQYAAKLLDRDGKEIATMPFSPDSIADHPDLPSALRRQQLPRHFAVSLPFLKEARRLVIDKAGRRLAEVHISERAPDLSLTQQALGRITEPTTVSWQARDPDGDRVEFDVYLVYPDGTRTAVATGLRTAEFTI